MPEAVFQLAINGSYSTVQFADTYTSLAAAQQAGEQFCEKEFRESDDDPDDVARARRRFDNARWRNTNTQEGHETWELNNVPWYGWHLVIKKVLPKSAAA